VIDGCLACMDNPAITIDELVQIIPGPDFPTAPLILGGAGARKAYHEGRGSIIMRSRHVVEESGGRGSNRAEGRRSIVLTSIPYQVGKN
ncbi:DNA gyrase subunit A, partial [Acinetobacter baumannii]